MPSLTDHQALAGVQIRDESIAELRQLATEYTWVGDRKLSEQLTQIADELETAAGLLAGAR
ncbi:hypothetical protein [Nocardia sp. NPDC055049]